VMVNLGANPKKLVDFKEGSKERRGEEPCCITTAIKRSRSHSAIMYTLSRHSLRKEACL